MHQRAQPAAEAAHCAGAQGKFWEFHDKVFADQKALADADLEKHATDLGLNVDAYKECFSSGKFRADIQKDASEGQEAGVSGTPAFFVNGRFLSGAQPFEAFQAIIDEELKK